MLVPRQEIAEALGGEQHLVAVEGPALVDVHEAAIENGALLGESVLREEQVDGGLVDLPAQGRDLPVQLVDDAVGGVLLVLEVGELVGDAVGLSAQPLELLLDRRALAADVLEAALVVAHLLLERRALSGNRNSQHRGENGVEEQRGGKSYCLHGASQRCPSTSLFHVVILFSDVCRHSANSP